MLLTVRLEDGREAQPLHGLETRLRVATGDEWSRIRDLACACADSWLGIVKEEG